MKYYVYILFRPWNGQPCYVGKGQGSRFKNHQKAGHKHKNRHLASIFKKANDELPFEILGHFDDERAALSVEKLYIKMIGRADKSKGPLANWTDGGEGVSGRIVGKIEREIRRDRFIGNKFALGHKVSQDVKERISDAKKGRPGTKMTDEQKAALSLRMRGNNNGSGNKGNASARERMRGNRLASRPHSEAWKLENSIRMKRIWAERKTAKEVHSTV